MGERSTVLIAVLILGGCAAGIEMNGSFVPPNTAQTGVVVVSVTSTGRYGNALSGNLSFECVSGASGKLENSYGLARYIDGDRLSIPISADLQLSADRPMGKIHVVQLPPGKCVFHNFRASASNGTVTTSWRSSTTMNIPFSVKANAFEYVGNFDMNWSPNKGVATFNDFYDRDLTVIRKQNPALLGREVEKSVAKVSSW